MDFIEKIKGLASEMKKVNDLKFYLQYMNRREKQAFFSFIAFQFLNGILEILAISIAGVAVSLVTLEITGQSSPNYLQDIFDSLLIGNNSSTTILSILIAVSATLLIIKTLISIQLNLKLNLFLGKVTARVSSEKLGSISKANYNWLKNHDHAAIAYFLGAGITNDLKSILLGITMLITESIFLFSVFFYLFLVDYKIALTLTILIGVSSYLALSLSHMRLRRIGSSEVEVLNQNNSEMLAFLRGYKELRVSKAIFRYGNRLSQRKAMEADLRARIQWLEQVPKFFLEVMIILIGLLLFTFAAFSSDARWGTSTLMIFSLVIVRSTPSILRLQTGASLIRFNVTRFNSTKEFLAQLDCDVEDPPTRSTEITTLTGGFLFNSVSFSYSDSVPLIDDLTFQSPGPGVTCIVGPSGAGKSTVLELLVGLIKPSSGSITIDGRAPSDWNNLDRATMYYLPQEVFLYEATLRENLILGVTGVVPSDEELCEALAAVGLESIFSPCQKSLDLTIGRDLKVSGGERQRIGFARALLAKPLLLILDEPTAALDRISETQIFSLIQQLGSDRNIILVSHSEQIQVFSGQVVFLKEREV